MNKFINQSTNASTLQYYIFIEFPLVLYVFIVFLSFSYIFLLNCEFPISPFGEPPGVRSAPYHTMGFEMKLVKWLPHTLRSVAQSCFHCMFFILFFICLVLIVFIIFSIVLCLYCFVLICYISMLRLLLFFYYLLLLFVSHYFFFIGRPIISPLENWDCVFFGSRLFSIIVR